jgi:hypothetical protein
MKQVWTSPAHARPSDEAAYVDWLRPVPWQLFCTFTFAWPVSDPQAGRVFAVFIDRLERFLRGPIIFVRGDEKRFSGCGKPGAPRHFHAVMTAHRRIDPCFVTDLWMSLAGRRQKGAGADVRIYDSSRPGLAYVLKFIDQPNGDWDLRNLDLFLPSADRESLNRRQRRRLARHKNRLEPLQGRRGKCIEDEPK